MGVAIRSKKPFSPAWLRFAQEVVECAGVLEEETARILITAFAAVPRDKFLPESSQSQALEDRALAIGFGQFTTKPSVLARMLAVLGLQRGLKILEVGCGSGYSSAVMTAAGAQVFGLESIGLLAQQTRRRLDGLGYQGVLIRSFDGLRGWAEHAPFDAILIGAEVSAVESDLLSQLTKPGGRLIAPIGTAQEQVLTLWEAKGENVVSYQLERGNFVYGEA